MKLAAGRSIHYTADVAGKATKTGMEGLRRECHAKRDHLDPKKGPLALEPEFLEDCRIFSCFEERDGVRYNISRREVEEDDRGQNAEWNNATVVLGVAEEVSNVFGGECEPREGGDD